MERKVQGNETFLFGWKYLSKQILYLALVGNKQLKARLKRCSGYLRINMLIRLVWG